MRTRAKGEYISHTRLTLSLKGDHVGNLNHRIVLGFRKVAFATSTFNILNGEESVGENVWLGEGMVDNVVVLPKLKMRIGASLEPSPSME